MLTHLDSSWFPLNGDRSSYYQHFFESIERAISLANEFESLATEPTPSFERVADILKEIEHTRALGRLLQYVQKVDFDSEYSQLQGDTQVRLSVLEQKIHHSPHIHAVCQKILKQEMSLQTRASLEHELRCLEFTQRCPVKDLATLNQIAQQMQESFNQYMANKKRSFVSWLYCLTQQELQSFPEKYWPSLLKEFEYSKDLISQKHAGLPPSHYAVSLSPRTFEIILSHSRDRNLRQRAFQAYLKICSDNSLDTDNTQICTNIAKLRHSLAQLFGFSCSQEFYQSNRSVHGAADTEALYLECLQTIQQCAQKEWAALADFAYQQDRIEVLKPWDRHYYIEKYIKNLSHLGPLPSDSLFPLDRVLATLSQGIEDLFGVTLQLSEAYQSDCESFVLVIHDLEKKLLGYIHCDLYQHRRKKHGTSITPLHADLNLKSHSKIPLSMILCRFRQRPHHRLTLNELLIFAHEMGHAVHHSLRKNHFPRITGLSALPCDMSEIASLLFELYCLRPQPLQKASWLSSKRRSLKEKEAQLLISVKQMFRALRILEKLQIGLFDSALHSQPEASLSELWQKSQETCGIDPSSPLSFLTPQNFPPLFSPMSGYESYFVSELYANHIMEKISDFDSLAAAGQQLRESFFNLGTHPHIRSSLEEKFLGEPLKTEPFLKRLSNLQTPQRGQSPLLLSQKKSADFIPLRKPLHFKR